MPTGGGCPLNVLGVVPGPGLLFGLILLAAIIGGYAARWVHIPRVIGFLIGGLALQVLLNVLLDPVEGAERALAETAAPLGAINDLALGMILFSIGAVFERSRLRAVKLRVVRIGLLEMGMVAGLVGVGCGLATMAAQPGYGLGSNLALALLLATAGIATAPAATLFVLREYEAKGPITETVLGLVGLNNIVCIVAFNTAFLALTSVGLITTSGPLSEFPWQALLTATLGSVVLGLFCGALISLAHGKLPLAETSLIFFATLIILGAGEKWLLEHVGLSFNFLLTALVIGAVFHNVAIDSQKLDNALRPVAAPIMAGFFVMAGYNLHLGQLLDLGWVGGVYVVCRATGKILGARLGVAWADESERVGLWAGSTLLCQAAVVIGLAAFVERTWDSPLAGQFSTIILGSVVLFELVGPLLIKRVVVQGGEVKAVTLLGRAKPATGGVSVLKLTARSLLRLVGLGHTPGPEMDAKSMQVRHIMRSSVHFLPASATLDEVLHFIERSTYSHFPVVDNDDHFCGMIHFSDVRDVIYDPTMRQLVTAMDLADPSSTLVPTDLPLPKLLEVFHEQNIGLLPVGAESGARRVVGVVEQRDLLRVLHVSADKGV